MMRTTVRLDPELLTQAKKIAAGSGRTLTAVIEDALRQTFSRRPPKSRRKAFRMRTFRGKGVLPGVDLDDSSSLVDRMEAHDSDRR